MKERKVTGGIPQGLILGALWKIMYSGILMLAFPENVMLVAFVDDITIIIIVTKCLEKFSLLVKV